MLDIDPADLAALDEVERDAHGHLRIAEVNIGEILKAQVAKRLKELGIKTTHRRQEHRLRAALRRPDPVRHGVHARPRLLRGEVPARRAATRAMISMQGGHFVPIPFARDARSRHRPHASPPGRHPLHALRDRAPLHDPAAARRLRRSARAGEVRGDGGHVAGGVPPASSSTSSQHEPPPLAMDARMGGFVEPAAP